MIDMLLIGLSPTATSGKDSWRSNTNSLVDEEDVDVFEINDQLVDMDSVEDGDVHESNDQLSVATFKSIDIQVEVENLVEDVEGIKNEALMIDDNVEKLDTDLEEVVTQHTAPIDAPTDDTDESIVEEGLLEESDSIETSFATTVATISAVTSPTISIIIPDIVTISTAALSIVPITTAITVLEDDNEVMYIYPYMYLCIMSISFRICIYMHIYSYL